MSGNDDLKVHYGSVELIADDISKAAGVVDKQLQDIWAAVEKVTGGWQGEAHTMMIQAKLQFDARGTHIKSILTEIATKIKEGSADYRQTDKKASQLFDISY
ncbi:WXG100 family type VII secretion target [Streptomyces sp. UNOC14_S4]|uniref:WXG100 family type VII secretion target n=1 Tax=Streptomyces sp. UNOC14_S4 TaxID=2872340 RepID=UPI001E4ACAC1|nr:WXG100 family type VII secretion target [Streptomyces sp. UNOC14_S4]MCC3766644.1 WXG100 family type VII secretion target [Streptomyces sp. UNOC14_S4]